MSAVVWRVLRSVLVLAVVITLTFLVFYVGPADPALAMCGRPCSPEALESVRAYMGFDSPWWVQLWLFVAAIFVGRTYGGEGAQVECSAPCLGYSFQMHEPVTTLIVDRFPVSLSIGLGAIVLWVIIGVAVGAVAAWLKGGVTDRVITGLSVMSASAPAYLVGLLAIVLFAFTLDWLPSGGYVPLARNPGEWLRHLVLPWIVLAVLNGAVYARLVRSLMVEQLGQEYVRAARAFGQPERRVGGYALRNVAMPVSALVALDVGALLGGTVITERVFGLPGLGALLMDAVGTVDLPVIVGATLVSAVLVILANLVADVIGPLLDPRIVRRRSSGRDPSAAQKETVV